MKQVDQFLSTSQVAQDLSVCRGTVFRMITDGRLPAIKMGRGYRIPLEPYLSIKAKLLHVDDPNTPEFHTLIDAWLNHLANGPRPHSPRTVDDYRYNLVRYLRTIGGASDARTVFRRESVLKVIEAIPVQGHARKCHLVSTLVSFLKWLTAKEMLASEVVQELQGMQPRTLLPPRRTVLEGDQDDRFLARRLIGWLFNPTAWVMLTPCRGFFVGT
jgi:excisionase family DNA binding protein